MRGRRLDRLSTSCYIRNCPPTHCGIPGVVEAQGRSGACGVIQTDGSQDTRGFRMQCHYPFTRRPIITSSLAMLIESRPDSNRCTAENRLPIKP
jgi:hypothetical protein